MQLGGRSGSNLGYHSIRYPKVEGFGPDELVSRQIAVPDESIADHTIDPLLQVFRAIDGPPVRRRPVRQDGRDRRRLGMHHHGYSGQKGGYHVAPPDQGCAGVEPAQGVVV